MNSEELKQLGPLWLECFDNDLRELFESEAKNEATRIIAQSIFWAAWQEFKRRCAENRIILDKTEVLELLRLTVSWEEIWFSLVDADDDWLIFYQMKIQAEQEKEYLQTNTYARRQLNKKGDLKKLIKQTMSQSRMVNSPDDRIRVFIEELKILIEQINKNNIVCTTEQLKELLSKELINLPPYFLDWVDQFASRLSRPQKKKVLPSPKEIIEVIPISKITTETVKTSKTEVAPPPLVVHEPVIDFDNNGRPRILMSTKCYEVTKDGLKSAIDALIPFFEPLDFYRKLKNLLSKIEVHCRDHYTLNDLLKIVHELKNDFYLIYNKDDKSPLGLKRGYVYSALGLFEAALSEKLAPFFNGKATVKSEKGVTK